jgi:hypothetical protein
VTKTLTKTDSKRYFGVALFVIVACASSRTGPYFQRRGFLVVQGRYWRGLPDGTWTATSDKYGTVWRVTYVHGKREGACFTSYGDGVTQGSYNDDLRHGTWLESVSTDCVEGNEYLTQEGHLAHLPETCRGAVRTAGNYIAGVRDGEWRFGTARAMFSQGKPRVIEEAAPSEALATVVGSAEPGSIIAIGDRATLVENDGRFRVSGIEPGRYPLINADATRWNFKMLDVGPGGEVEAGKRMLDDFTIDCPAKQ